MPASYGDHDLCQEGSNPIIRDRKALQMLLHDHDLVTRPRSRVKGPRGITRGSEVRDVENRHCITALMTLSVNILSDDDVDTIYPLSAG